LIGEEKDSFLKEEKKMIESEFDSKDPRYEDYTYSVNQRFDFKTRKITRKKMLYVMTEALSDLGLKKFTTIEF